MYTSYNCIDSFIKCENKKTEKKIKTTLYSGIGAISFPLIITSICNNLKNTNNQPFFKTTAGKCALALSSVIGLVLPFIEIKNFD